MTETADRRIAVIGLDGATWDILDRAIESGYLPTLRSIRESGVTGDLRSTYPPITPTAWPTFLTGTNPGRHSVAGFAQPVSKGEGAGCEFRMNNSGNIEARTLWEYLSSRGRTIVSLNLPMTYPPFEVNGALVSGLMTPNTREEFVHPPELQEELLDRDFRPFVKHVAGEFPECSNEAEYRDVLDRTWELVERKFEQARFVDDQVDWDVFFMQIQETDPVQHFMLGFYEEDHDWYDPVMESYVFEEFYSKIDRAIGELIDEFGDDVLTFVVSDHGFQTVDRAAYVGNWLHEHGFAESSSSGELFRKTIDLVKKFDVLDLRRHLPNAREIAKKKESFTFDWSESAAISIGAGTNPIVPIYVLQDGPERDRTVDRLVEQLSTFTDPETGEEIVAEIIPGDEVYEGQYADQMPDLLVKAKPNYAFLTTAHLDEPTVIDLVEERNRPGIHHEHGILAATGANVTDTRRVDASLADIAPTILYYLGEPVPEYMDGTVLTDLFDDSFNDRTEIDYTDVPPNRDDRAPAAVSASEREGMRETLSELGYID
jgi:predicted AlkP superfamily phosphohydrolase/phosphomutase